MKTLNTTLKKNDWLPLCDPNKVIYHFMHNGIQIKLPNPTLAKDLTCERCGGNEGFFIPHLSTWSCRNIDCIHVNANRFSKVHNPLKFTKIQKVELCDQSKEVLDFFTDYVKSPNGFVVLAGKNGTGKSYLSNAVLHDFNCDESDKKMITQVDLNEEYKDHFNKYSSTSFLIQKYADLKLLIIDDLGTRRPSEAFMDFLYAVADKRFAKKSATIITTNLKSPAMREMFGDAFFSRVTYNKVFKFEGEDRRSEVEF